MLSSDMGLHCHLKNSFKTLVFSKKLETNLSRSKGGMIGNFLPFTNVLNIIQYVFADA